MTKQTKVEVTAEQTKVTAERIERALSYFRKEVAPLIAKLEKAQGGLSKYAMETARDAVKLAKGDLTMAVAYFNALIRSGERAFCEKHEVKSVKELIPSWPPIITYIRTSMEEGLSPVDFDTETAMRAARDAAREAKHAGARNQGGASGPQGGAEGEGAAAVAKGGNCTAKLEAVLRVLAGSYPAWTAEAQDAFADELATLVAKYNPKRTETAEKPAEVKVA